MPGALGKKSSNFLTCGITRAMGDVACQDLMLNAPINLPEVEKNASVSARITKSFGQGIK